MSDTIFPATSSRTVLKDGLIRIAVAVVALALVAGLFALVSQAGGTPEAPPAPRHPFAAGASEAAPSATGIGGTILAVQSVFYTRMIAALQAFSSDKAAMWTLIGLSFAYGIFHAAGPGHGKAVISGYLVADGRRSMRRGLGLAFASSLLQAVSAIVIVGTAVLALKATAASVNATAGMIERASFLLVAIVGLVVLWRKAGRLTTLLHPPPAAPAGTVDSLFGGLALPPAGKAASGRFRAETVETGDTPAACEDASCRAGGLCGHIHLLTPADLKQIHSTREMAMVALSAGLRPCSGAIIVLVFAFAQGLPASGVAAVFAMALGTFITVGALAGLAVFAKRLATRVAGGTGAHGARAIAVLEVLAGALVAMTGLALVLG